MQSAIILGTVEKTKEKVKEIIAENKISKFDQDYISSEKTIAIADIRFIQKKIFLKPISSPKKAVILEAFTGITNDAQNAFLKILEEPPTDTIILILTTTTDFILPTVLSRCTLIDVNVKKQLSEKESNEYSNILTSILNREENPMVIAQKYSKDKDLALQFLENMIITTEKNIDQNVNLAKALKNMQNTHTIIKSTNVNVRFALENLFLNL